MQNKGIGGPNERAASNNCEKLPHSVYNGAALYMPFPTLKRAISQGCDRV
ncbi:hypothetical protein PMHK_10610 [Pseudomonas sp. MHK4]